MRFLAGGRRKHRADGHDQIYRIHVCYPFERLLNDNADKVRQPSELKFHDARENAGLMEPFRPKN